MPEQEAEYDEISNDCVSKLHIKSAVRPISEKQTRVEILQHLSERTNLKRVEVEAVFDEMLELIKAHMKDDGSGEIIIPKLGLKIKRIAKKATKHRKMISPLTGKEVEIPSKPARDEIKVISLKTLKESVYS